MTPADRARRECERQGIPFEITDRVTIEAIAAVLHQAVASAVELPAVVRPGRFRPLPAGTGPAAR